jgi:hypothetical protein
MSLTVKAIHQSMMCAAHNNAFTNSASVPNSLPLKRAPFF